MFPRSHQPPGRPAARPATGGDHVRMSHSPMAVLAAAAATAITAASCSSSSTSTTSSGSPAPPPGRTYTIGVLTDLTGLAASTERSVPLGIKAGVGSAAEEGYRIKYVVADAATSPTGALTAAQKLVDQDHVFAVIALSALTFSAADFLTSRGVPVVGAAIDGPEWLTAKNMFSIDGTEDFTKVYDVAGKFYKMEGVTNLAALGYGITPSSALSTKDTAASAETSGTNVGPAAIAIKDAGSNGLYSGVETNTAFALITALRQAGAHMKAALLPIG